MSEKNDHEIKTHPEQISFDELLQERVDFYQELKKNLPEGSIGLYPAPGCDPVPVHVFGKDVTYFALPDDGREHVAILKKELEPPLLYAKFIKDKGPFFSLKAVFGNILYPPFKKNTFKFIILRNPPSFLYDNPLFITQIDKLLQEEGILIFDCEDEKVENSLNKPIHDDAVRSLQQRGYTFDPAFDLWKGEYSIYLRKENTSNKKWYLGTHQFRVLRKH
ncbi:MAG: hypothetical protein KatS3mg089_0159 [Patescibacteria group bacterium]|nr:MAG: hypothetical protein KatS3mg089_0159 [Patescibacteria group bacterium]